MAFELRVTGKAPAQFATEPDAVAAARQEVQSDPDAEIEIIDLDTGKPAAPAASKSWREELRNRVGF